MLTQWDAYVNSILHSVIMNVYDQDAPGRLSAVCLNECLYGRPYQSQITNVCMIRTRLVASLFVFVWTLISIISIIHNACVCDQDAPGGLSVVAPAPVAECRPLCAERPSAGRF